jgi:hypothetical protein
MNRSYRAQNILIPILFKKRGLLLDKNTRLPINCILIPNRKIQKQTCLNIGAIVTVDSRTATFTGKYEGTVLRETSLRQIYGGIACPKAANGF